VWQKRFYDHLIRDEDDLGRHVEYAHFNPVKHGYARCPHGWAFSSFHRWVDQGWERPDWYCCCDRPTRLMLDLSWATDEME